jgi:hypothetical protein
VTPKIINPVKINGHTDTILFDKLKNLFKIKDRDMINIKTLQWKLRRLRSSVFFALVLVLIHHQTLMAEEISASTNLSLQVSSLPEAKLSMTQSFTFPFLQGSGPLTSGNNIKAGITAELSPVSLGGIGSVVWTPVAFLELTAGARLGSGWNMALGNGIGLNIPINGISDNGSESPRKSEINGSAFDGLHWGAWLGGAFQFDLGAVIPGYWNHVIFRGYDELRYSAYTRAAPGDSWVFENDRGENRNGWTYYISGVLGYQMPLSPVLDFVGLMAETTLNLYDTPGREYWGDNLPAWILSGLLNFTINPRFSTSLILQMRTLRNYGASDLENRERLWYQDLELRHDNGVQRILFYRAVLIFSYKLR